MERLCQQDGLPLGAPGAKRSYQYQNLHGMAFDNFQQEANVM
jgi:hypothetical protein